MSKNVFAKENMARLTADERRALMAIQMAPRLTGHNPYLPDDCGECDACGDTMFGSGLCNRCFAIYDRLMDKALAVRP